MSKEVFWGLTTRDFEKGMWNTLHECATMFAGFAAAAVANQLIYTLLQSANSTKKADNNAYSFLAGAAAGIGAATYAAYRLDHVTFAGEKALKFFVLSLAFGATGGLFGKMGTVIGFIASGGALGYFGRLPLFVLGWASALGTSKYLYKVHDP